MLQNEFTNFMRLYCAQLGTICMYYVVREISYKTLH